MSTSLGKLFLHELEAEVKATRRCLERIPGDLFDYKPHERSMPMGYLVLIVAELPGWIAATIETNEIDFATYKPFQAKTTEDLVNHFDNCMQKARTALEKVTDEELAELFYFKNSGVTLTSERKDDSIMSLINHLVHHRGQLTVYMRLNDIMVPSIYGPSADEKTF
ncbi:MAG: DinB family protein [Ignavibacteriaceae bacterium]|nr:DinB family protein [Ignavibacteriaceae bacterium]